MPFSVYCKQSKEDKKLEFQKNILEFLLPHVLNERRYIEAG